MTRKNYPFTGWHVLDGETVIFFIPYSASFEFNGSRYMAACQSSADDIARMIIRANNEAEAAYFRSHPEINP